MLGKLLKHEFRATGRIMLPLYLVLLVISAFGNVASRIMEHSTSTFLNLLAGLTITAFTFILVTVALMSIWMMVSRFHKNLLTDEGYLMFTLPVSVHKLLLSKILVSIVWFVMTFLMSLVAFGVLLFRLDGLQYFFGDLIWIAQELFREFGGHTLAFALEILVLVVLGCASCCLVVYASAAVGHSFANHKILLSVGVFFGFNFISQFLGMGALFSLDGLSTSILEMVASWDPWTQVHTAMGAGILLTLAYCAVFYLITAISLQKRINLE